VGVQEPAIILPSSPHDRPVDKYNRSNRYFCNTKDFGIGIEQICRHPDEHHDGTGIRQQGTDPFQPWQLFLLVEGFVLKMDHFSIILL
jgi:hypothetical protein